MPNLTDDGANAILDLGLVDGDLLRLIADGGAAVSGGSYADQSVSWSSATGRRKGSSADVVFSGMPTVTVVGWELWDSTATVKKWLGALVELSATVDGPGDAFNSPAHGHVDDDPVAFTGSFPGVSAWTAYYVINSTTDTFQIAATPGGSVIALDDGYDQLVLGVGNVIAATAGDSMTFAADTLDMNLNS